MKRVLPFAILLILSVSLAALAEQAVRFGDVEVHYNAMLTVDLQPEVARAYGIDRSNNRGLATLAVLKKNAAGVAQPIKAAVNVSSVNAVGQVATVSMREIQEQAAIYYIGTFRVGAEETLKFKVEVTPEGGGARKFEFQKAFFP